ncbi:hypothetical protein AGDE_14358 [Angomonas deanei]|nr:hypothetical protein AGDE_14358 [Angomonas deanei]|eukprot:EPY21008.1 hypothetical protein AGDE_14358 [Angomonas deanei]
MCWWRRSRAPQCLRAPRYRVAPPLRDREDNPQSGTRAAPVRARMWPAWYTAFRRSGVLFRRVEVGAVQTDHRRNTIPLWKHECTGDMARRDSAPRSDDRISMCASTARDTREGVSPSPSSPDSTPEYKSVSHRTSLYHSGCRTLPRFWSRHRARVAALTCIDMANLPFACIHHNSLRGISLYSGEHRIPTACCTHCHRWGRDRDKKGADF